MSAKELSEIDCSIAALSVIIVISDYSWAALSTAILSSIIDLFIAAAGFKTISIFCIKEAKETANSLTAGVMFLH